MQKELSLWHVQEAFQQQRQNGESRSDPSGDAQDVWAIERPDDLEECEGSSPRKRPMGVSVFAGEPSDSFDLDAIDPKLSVRQAHLLIPSPVQIKGCREVCRAPLKFQSHCSFRLKIGM